MANSVREVHNAKFNISQARACSHRHDRGHARGYGWDALLLGLQHVIDLEAWALDKPVSIILLEVAPATASSEK